MSRIRIKDIPRNISISPEEMRSVLGGESTLTNIGSIGQMDVCSVPSAGGPIPIPYPNIGMSADTATKSKKIKVSGAASAITSDFKMSSGDESGSL